MNEDIQKKLDHFFMEGTPLSFKKGDIILRAGTPISQVYYLKKGHVRQFLNTEDGQDLTLHLFKPVAFFPTMLLLSQRENRYNFEAIDDTLLFLKQGSDVIVFLKKNPDVLFDFATRLSMGIIGLLEKIESESYTSAYKKVVSLLIYLSNRHGIKNDSTVTLSLSFTHNDIASWTGMQRETASRQIEKLKKKGVIAIQDGTFFINSQKLQQENEI